MGDTIENGNGFKEKIFEFKGAVGAELAGIQNRLDKIDTEEEKQWNEIRSIQVNAAKVGVISGIITAIITTSIGGVVLSIVLKSFRG